MLILAQCSKFTHLYKHPVDTESKDSDGHRGYRISDGPKVQKPIPWQVYLKCCEDHKCFKGSGCGGSILDSKTILTAAHCVLDKYMNIFSFCFIRAGSTHKFEGKKRFVENIIVHKQLEFNQDPGRFYLSYDFAIFFQSKFSIICILPASALN